MLLPAALSQALLLAGANVQARCCAALEAAVCNEHSRVAELLTASGAQLPASGGLDGEEEDEGDEGSEYGEEEIEYMDW